MSTGNTVIWRRGKQSKITKKLPGQVLLEQKQGQEGMENEKDFVGRIGRDRACVDVCAFGVHIERNFGNEDEP